MWQPPEREGRIEQQPPADCGSWFTVRHRSPITLKFNDAAAVALLRRQANCAGRQRHEKT
jgi:hypothetical protein